MKRGRKVDHSKKLGLFIEKLKKIKEIEAIVLTGSTASKSWDKYSDIDVDIYVHKKNFDKIYKALPRILKLWGGQVHLCDEYGDGCKETWVFIGNNFLKVEIDPLVIEEAKPSYWLKDRKVVYDQKNKITKIFKQSQKLKRPKKEKIPKKEIEHCIKSHLDWQFYTARHFMRGLKFSAKNEVGSCREDLVGLLVKMKGLEGWEFVRDAEEHFDKKELELVEGSIPKSYSKKEVQRAMSVNWEFLKFLVKRWEKENNSKIIPSWNEKKILSYIKRIYDGEAS